MNYSWVPCRFVPMYSHKQLFILSFFLISFVTICISISHVLGSIELGVFEYTVPLTRL